MRSPTRRPIARILLTALLAASGARAEIAGEQVVSGTATFEQSGVVTTIHASDGAIINYSQFDIWTNEELHFVQPSSDSRVLNRVFGDASYIDGGLYANGIVYIVNPAGIFFGPLAVVDVGGLYAAAGDISNEDFLARIDNFTLSGIVENAGSIESPAVALLGTAVQNHGNIHAPDGTIALVAGEKVILTQLGAHLAVEVEGVGGGAEMPAIEQTGTVDAGAGAVSFTTGDVYSLAINHTGITRGREIELRAGSGTVQVAGTLDASDRSPGATGGSIAVTGERVALLGAQLDASGDAGGGEIRVGGDLHGEGALPTARRTYVDEASALRADAISEGDGGRVIVWADEATAFHGALSARGGAAGGDGGFAEISGAALAADGDVDLSAASGATGTLLYDPKDIVLHAGALDGSDAPDASDATVSGTSLGQVLFGDPDELATPFDVYESELEGTNANIVLEATNSISSGDTFDVRILDGNSLTMQTRNNTDDDTGTSFTPGIHLASVSFQTGGTGGITIATGTDGAGGGGTGSAAGIEVGNLTTAGGAVSVTTEDGAIAVGNVTTAGAAGAVDGGAGGAIALTANDADQSGDSHVTAGVLNASGGDGGTGAGGSGGAVTVRSVGALEDIAGTTTDPTLGGGGVTVAGIDTTGGTGATTGGLGGVVAINTTDGAITATGTIDTSGGAGGTTGGNAGTIAIDTRDADRDGANHVTTAALVARGGSGTSGAGGLGGSVTINTRRSIAITGATDPLQNQDAGGGGNIAVASADTSGGDGSGGSGGAGGGVQLATENGGVTVGAIDTSGANGATGGAGGAISIIARDAGDQPTSDVVTGVLNASGGDGGTGAGGRGGAVTVQSIGTVKTVPGGSANPVLGGGAITVAGVDTTGGAGATTGGVGGAVVLGGRVNSQTGALINPTDGAITVNGDIDTSGGAGGTTGGNAGSITISARDANQDGANDVTTAGLIARGGDGTTGSDGQGGAITVKTLESIEITGADDPSQNQDAAGGGDIRLLGNIDARTGTDTKDVRDGGAVTLVADGDIEHGGQVGPQIDTQGSVSLTARGNIGMVSPLEIKGGGEEEDTLDVSAGGRADVHVTNAGFLGGLFAVATTVDADIDVTQFGDNGGNVIDMAGSGGQMVVNRVDTRDNQVGVASVAFLNSDEDAPDGTLVLATDSVDAGRTFQAFSDGDLVLGTTDGVVIHSVKKDPGADPEDAIDPGFVFLFADNDTDGTGALLDAAGAATGRIDMRGDAAEPGELDLLAGSGIGMIGDPITVSGGARLAALVEPLKPDPDNDGEFILDPDASDGIYLRNEGSGDLEIVSGSQTIGVRVDAGVGDVEITNFAGGISVESALRAKPLDNEDGTSNGAGGDVTLTVAPGSQIVLDVSRFSNALAIGSGGTMIYNGDVVLARATEIEADGGVDINGGLDTIDSAASPVGFTATLGDEATDVTPFAVRDGVGATRPLASFTVAAPDGGDVALDTPGVRTTGSQTYLSDLQLPQFTAFDAGTQIRFDAAGDQTVTGPAGFSLATSGVPISPEATIAKPNGNLTLTSSSGSILIGDGEKLSVAGSLAITATAGTVRFTDLSALDISVTSPDVQLFARAPGPVATPGGATIVDGGTDLVANTVAFSTAPTVVGGGPAPRIATPSGTAQNAGALSVGTLPVAISAADIASGSRVFDLAIPAVDPGHETQEIPTAALEPPIEPQPSQDRAGPGAPVSREEVVAFFACAPLADEAALASCAAAAPAPAYGSALDTKRAVEIARAYRELVRDSPDAAAGRAALARAAADPRAEIGRASSPAGRVYLTEVARVLGQVRLLGLGERYGEVRADLLAAVAAAIRSSQLDAARLGAAVDARAMGMPI